MAVLKGIKKDADPGNLSQPSEESTRVDTPTESEFANYRFQALETAHLETLTQLSRIVELRDDETGDHTTRVARLSSLIAQNLHLPPEEVRLIYLAAPVHDIGKLVIPDKILLKQTPLDEGERLVMRGHTTLASEILGCSDSEIIKMAEQIARHHHERWDGQGYPDGLMGPETPLPARIVAVADAFDAMTNNRPHRAAAPLDLVLEEFKQESGWQFDPAVVEALFRALESDEAALTPRSSASARES